MDEREFVSETAEGFRVRAEKCDWLIPEADLSFTPRNGDRITRSLDSSVYEVLPPEDGKQSYALDESGYVYRLHVKRVA